MIHSRKFLLILAVTLLPALVGITGCLTIGLPVPPAPTISLASGSYATPQTVSLADADPSAAIYYTADGSLPSATSTAYTKPIRVDMSLTVRAIAVSSGGASSALVAATYTIAPIVPRFAAAPTFTPPSGSYPSGQTVSLADATPNATIFYTTDGTLPTTASPTYTAPFSATTTETVQALATAPGYSESPISSATYSITLPSAAAPTFNPPGGSYNSVQTVSLADTTPNATLFYTTDGTTPTTSSNVYSTPFPISSTSKVQAIATAPNYLESRVATATYTIGLPSAAAPTFNPAGGTYASAQTITLADATPNATIFYTTDGSTPSTSSTLYSSAIQIASTATVQAIATAPNYLQSPPGIATYIIGAQPSGTGKWTWMGGSKFAGESPVYGTLGLSSASNTPGDNLGGVVFNGPNGTLMLFGGYNNQNSLVRDALWQYNPKTSQWTWLAGPNTTNAAGNYGVPQVPSASNFPPSRDFAPTWSDGAGTIYFFGGGTAPNGIPTSFNDLWSWNSQTSEFTWIDGSNLPNSYGSYGSIGLPSANSVPSARSSSGNCTDNQGKLWIFGGVGPNPPLGNSGFLNDLWQFNPANNTWTWFTGSEQINQPGIYGTRGTPNQNNTPGGRIGMACWTAPDGKLWFFGGYGFDISPSGQGFQSNNDLWRFDPQTLEWTWISGSDVRDQLGSYGALGQPAASNFPGAREDFSHWSDPSGNLWLFGGAVLNSYYNVPQIANDLWRYNIASGEWTWMSGDPSAAVVSYPVYGVLGVAAPQNTPGSRDSAATWVDTDGNLWLFGGYGYDSTGNAGSLSDLWRYHP